MAVASPAGPDDHGCSHGGAVMSEVSATLSARLEYDDAAKEHDKALTAYREAISAMAGARAILERTEQRLIAAWRALTAPATPKGEK